MKAIFNNILRTIGSLYTGVNLYIQLLAGVLTYVLSASSLDWKYFLYFHGSEAFSYVFPAVFVGFLIPFLVPITLLIIGSIRRNARTLNAGYATAQAGILGWAISSFYKIFTGRPPPPEAFVSGAHAVLVNTSTVFRFGLFRGGVFNGWPSSHTTTAVALSTTLFVLFPKNKWIRGFALLYAVYVGFGVSVSIHWLSDFVAGVLIGLVIGFAVGKNFSQRLQHFQP